MTVETPATEPEEPYGNPESVVECLAIMREIGATARERNLSLDTKAASVAGFAGTALTLNLTLGRPLLLQRFSGDGHALIRDFFVASALLFAAAAVVAVVGILKPQATEDLDEEAIDGYAARPKVTTEPPELRVVWLQSSARFALSARGVGDVKARRSDIAVLLLAAGVVGLIGQALVLAGLLG